VQIVPVSLLSTKLYIPTARPDAVLRPRLVEKLHTGLGRPGSITLLSGPAGFGKTTLLSEWVSMLPQPPSWLSLDEGDNDPIPFVDLRFVARAFLLVGLFFLTASQVVRYGSPDEVFQGGLIDTVSLVKIDGPRIFRLQPGVKKASRIIQYSPFEKVQL
jgi:hypothetical protein